VAKAELGEKQTCPSCGAKFYDLRRRPAVCPKCAFTFDPADETFKVRRTRARAAPVAADYEEEEEDLPKARKGEEAGDEDEADESPELDEAVDVDAPELVDDDEEEDVIAPRAKGDEIPEGFGEEDEDAIVEEEDDGVPLLEDDEDFDEDELGPVGDDDEEAPDR
jgi:uncharacterized protein (TIGR02300 family)